jgi:Arginase family
MYQLHYFPSNANAAPHMVRRFDVVGADFVEVSPPYDQSGITLLLAARTSLDFVGPIFHERANRQGGLSQNRLVPLRDVPAQ